MNLSHLASAPGPVQCLEHWANTSPTATAILGNDTATSFRVSYAALWRDVLVRASWLRACGIRPGDTVALSLPIDPPAIANQVALLYAVAYLGAAVLPLYHDVPPNRWASLSEQLGAHWLISRDPPLALTGVRYLNPADFEEAAHPFAHGPVPRGDEPGRPFLYEFTSGTTGIPKVVLFPASKYTAMIWVAASQYGWLQSDVMVTPVRWPTKVGIKGLIRALILGATYVDEAFPETRQALHRLVNEMGVTSLGSSPWQLRRLLASPPDSAKPARVLRVLITAGAYVAPSDIQAARETITPNIHVGYGTTEIGTMAHLDSSDAASAPLRVVPGMEVQVIDAHGNSLAAGQPGRLRFRAPWIPQGYAGPARETAEEFHDGWFLTSDFGSLDTQGRLTLGGRADNIVNYGGTKISPRDVEGALLALADIADAALVGIADVMAGELPVAFVVLRRPISLAEIHAHLLTQLDPANMPVAVVATREIPRNPEGKVLRTPLRAMYAKLADTHK